jgi:sugar/nucleoside kinase (ribokinase family)
MYDITILGNAAVDRLMKVDEKAIAQLNLPKGNGDYSRSVNDYDIAVSAYGPAANTLWTMGHLGAKGYYISTVGEDDAGTLFKGDMQSAGIDMPEANPSSRTWEIATFITPDGERTFMATPNTAHTSAAQVSEEVIKNSKWLLIEGYTMLDQMDAVDQAIWLARKHGVKIAMTLANTVVIEQCYQNIFSEIVKGVDLMIANDEEMSALIRATEEHSHAEAVELAEKITAAPRVITYGEKGASFIEGGEKIDMPCEPMASPVDTTGAGDAFAAGFLYAYIKQGDVEKGLGLGHLLARSVISQVGGRLHVVGDDHKQAAKQVA